MQENVYIKKKKQKKTLKINNKSKETNKMRSKTGKIIKSKI